MSTQNTKVGTISEQKLDVISEKKNGEGAQQTSESTQPLNNSKGAEVQVTKDSKIRDGGKVFENSDSMQPMFVPNVKGAGDNTEVLDSLNEIDSKEGEKDEGKGPGSSKEVPNSSQEIVQDSKEDEKEKVGGPASSSKVPSSKSKKEELVNVVNEYSTGNLTTKKMNPNSTGNLQDKKEEESKSRSPPKQKIQPASKEDLRTSLLHETNPEDESGSTCQCLSCLKPDKDPCLCTDFLKCGEQWEKKPAKKYIRLLCLLLPAIAMIILQVVNDIQQDNKLTEAWCLSPRDKDGFGPLFVNIFFFWGWGDAICMTLVYVIIATSVMIRGNRVFLLVSLWIILASGLLYWGIALGSDCQAGVSTLNLGLAFFNLTQGGLECWWQSKMEINYYALMASLVTFTTYLALLFKKAIPDAHTSFWSHFYACVAGVFVSIAYAWMRLRKMKPVTDSIDSMA